ncbi:MAG: alpha-ketoglutarate-dependent dioxygenase AlkB [Pseudomonadota bacterium]
MTETLDFQGTKVWKTLLDRQAQEGLVLELRELVKAAPFQQYETPGGSKMSVRMTGAGAHVWMSDRSGYDYADAQPNGTAWPDIPSSLLSIWDAVAGVAQPPDSCLVNFYQEGARMGLHRDQDEANTDWPVVSISLGDDAQFRVGGLNRREPTKSIWLASGDVVVLTGASRLAYHGIDRIRYKSSTLLERGGRINVTLRVSQ